MGTISKNQAAEQLGISIESLDALKRQGIVRAVSLEGVDYYSPEEVGQIRSRHGPTLSDEALQISNVIQKGILNSVSNTKKIFLLVSGTFSGFALLVALFTVLFIISPSQTANWLGYIQRTNESKLSQINPNSNILGITTDPSPLKSTSPVKAIFRPASNISLGIVKYLSPKSYEQVTKFVILDPNDVFSLDADGGITPQQPIRITSDTLQIDNPTIVSNLNSQFLQGKEPGTNVGDIAIIGENGSIEGVAAPLRTPTPATTQTVITNLVTGITNANLSGSAGITDANLSSITAANKVLGSSVELNTSGGLSNNSGLSLLTSCSSGQILSWSGSTWECTTPTTSTTTEVDTLATVAARGAVSSSALTLSSISNDITIGTLRVNAQVFTDLTGTGLDLSSGSLEVSGLTTSEFASSNISQWTNNSGFISTSSVDTLTNKTLALPIISSISNTGTITIPTGTDTLVGKATADVLTNKTLTAPVINGVVTTTGLILPAFTAGGTITGSGSPTISNFGAINGLTLTVNGTGFSIAGGTTSKTLTMNNSLSLSGTDTATITFQGTDTYVGRTTSDTLTNKTLAAGSNTITGLTSDNLTAGDFSTKITSGTYSVDISGNASTATTATTATNFYGSLAGDVGGTQGATSVNKINGAVLGTTTASSGNILIGNGTQWLTQALSNDATLTSGGVLTLKNVGTSGTYGSALNIPLFVTDAQGRVTSVTNTAIAGITTSNLSASAGITNGQLANSSVTVNTTGPLGGGGLVSLGGTLTLNCTTCLVSGSSLFGASATNGLDSPITQGGTILFKAGTNLTTTNNGAGEITFATIVNPLFTTINGLSISNNGTNTLSIAAGKILTASNSLTLTGTDATSFAFPVSSDDLVGRVSPQILTNKTITAGSNTISGITNTNLSGTAAITNANLANSSVTINSAGILTGGGSISLGGTLNLTATEADTLQSAYGRGNTITTTTGRNITLTLASGLGSPTSMSLINNGTADSLLLTDAANANIDGTTRRSLLINPGAITQNTLASTGIYSGIDITLPALTLTSGTALTGNGVRVTTDGITQSTGALTSNGILVDSTSSTITTGGILNGVKISAPTTIPSIGTYNNLLLGTSTSSVANSYDQATIAVGNIASTAQQNFSTLNIRNAGTGYLDIELIKGFINFQSMNTLYDDFTGNALDTTTRWVSTPTGGATTCSFLAGGVNGLLRMRTGNAASRGCELTTQTITTLTNGYYQRANNPIVETKLKINTLTNARIDVGFTDVRIAVASDTTASSNHAYIGKRAADTKWQCITDDGGVTETINDTGVTIVADTFYRLRVELRNGTTPETICTVDDGTTVTRTVVTATQPGATSPMDVYVRNNQSDAIQKNMDVDYVRVWQDDPPLNLGTITPIDHTDEPSASDSSTIINPDELTSQPETGVLEKIVANAIHNLLSNIIDFLGNVIFHGDVSFLGHISFDNDTAGHAVIKSGQKQVSVNFEKNYTKNPIVTASINLAGDIESNELPNYAVFDVSNHGFIIKLSKATTIDLSFSWISLAANESSSKSNVLESPISNTIIPSVSSLDQPEETAPALEPLTEPTPSTGSGTLTE